MPSQCIICGEIREVCCDTGYSDNGIHVDPICEKCCACEGLKNIWDGKCVAGGVYERRE